MTGLSVLVLILVLAALIAPIIPMRRRRKGINGFPVVTLALLLANVLVFAANSTDGGLSESVGTNWGLVPSNATLLTLFTHMFLHGSWDHLFGNMLGLWLFGPHVEEALGRLEYLLFYLGCGMAAGLLHVLFAHSFTHGSIAVPMVGASGAIFGVLGLFAVRFWRTKVRILLIVQMRAIWAVSIFAGLQIVLGVLALTDDTPVHRTAYWAHVGGFLFGVILAVVLRLRDDSRREYSIEDAEAAVATGKLDQGAAHYRQLLKENADDAPAHQALARLCVQMRQGEAAHRHFTDAIRILLHQNDMPRVAKVYEEACRSFEVFPLPPNLLQRVASACEECQQYALAIRALTELCRDFPDSREAEMALLRLGKLHQHKLGQPLSAVGVFSEFLRLYPESEWHGHAQQMLNEAQAAAQRFAPLPAPNP